MHCSFDKEYISHIYLTDLLQVDTEYHIIPSSYIYCIDISTTPILGIILCECHHWSLTIKATPAVSELVKIVNPLV